MTKRVKAFVLSGPFLSEMQDLDLGEYANLVLFPTADDAERDRQRDAHAADGPDQHLGRVKPVWIEYEDEI